MGETRAGVRYLIRPSKFSYTRRGQNGSDAIQRSSLPTPRLAAIASCGFPYAAVHPQIGM
jgi:hypothetical protein